MAIVQRIQEYGPRLRFGGAVLASVLLLGACTSSYTYIKNSSVKTYFKVPNNWQIFDENQIFKSQISGLSPQGEAAAKASIWMVAFDANPKPSLNHFFSGSSPYPQGFAQVRQLSEEQKDSISLGSIRNTVFPLNQLQVQDPTSVEFLQNDDLVLQGGIHGNRIIFNVRLGDTFYTVNQTGLVNPQTSLLYLFVIGCEAHCYLNHKRTIDEIVKSWTVRER
ncbi:MAG TPA: hypothetical protein VGL18_15570 [Actinomycetota bacterium]|jgi:hypothetical protein